MKKYQSGFSAVEVVMMVVIIVLLGAVGWLFWDKIMNKPASETVTTSATSTKSSSPSPTVSTKTYTAKGINVAFDYPSTWTVTPDSNQSRSKYVEIGQVSGSERTLVKAPSGFTLRFNAVAFDGLGGTGPCNGVVRDYKLEGTTTIDNSYVQSFTFNDNFILWVSRANPVNCAWTDDDETDMNYPTILHVRDSRLSSDGMTFTEPFEIEFGTTVFGEYAASKTKPSDQEYKQAVEILKSLRKT